MYFWNNFPLSGRFNILNPIKQRDGQIVEGFDAKVYASLYIAFILIISFGLHRHLMKEGVKMLIFREL